MEKEQKILKVLDELELFPIDLLRIIISYSKERKWEPTPFKSWEIRNDLGLGGIKTDQRYLYICHPKGNSISIKDTNGKILFTNASLNYPIGLDLDEKNSLLYIIDREKVTIFDFELKMISFWNLPDKSPESRKWLRGIKVDETICYLTIEGFHKIFLCQTQNGKVIDTWGNRGQKYKEFHFPYGLTTNQNFLYVCDSRNQRIQLLNKKKEGLVGTHWGGGLSGHDLGQFSYPMSIYRDIWENIFYIGDCWAIQLFTENGKCIQRIDSGTYGNYVYGISIIDDKLYVCDYSHCKIQIFK